MAQNDNNNTSNENSTPTKNSQLPKPQYAIEGKVIAIGDVHGQLKKLQSLWRELKKNVPGFDEYAVVFLGDYVDRGSDVKGTLDFLTHLQSTRPNTHFICGNHDYAAALFLGLHDDLKPKDFSFKETWKGITKNPTSLWKGTVSETDNMHLQGRKWGYGDMYSSRPTFVSYGVKLGDKRGLNREMPSHHKKFLKELPWVIEHPDFIFVHAGLEDSKSLEHQLQVLYAKDITLARVPQLCSKSLCGRPEGLTKVIVSGHNLVPQVSITDKKILLDTTGGKIGEMSAILLPEKKVIQSKRL